jgi:hypothetical protein
MFVNIEKFGSGNNDDSQKVEIRIDDFDVWNADVTLSMIIAPLLKKLKDAKQGIPHIDNADVPSELRTDDSYSEERWIYALDEMIWTFENYGVGVSDPRTVNGLRLFGKYFYALWT